MSGDKLHRSILESISVEQIGVICLLFCLVFSGCAFRSQGSTKEDPRTKGEKQFDPLGFPQDQLIVTEKEPEREKEIAVEPEKDKKLRLKESKKSEIVFPRKVFRVQFFATQYPDEASSVSEAVKNQLSVNTYIDYKAPYYWVKVGDCETKEEAESLMDKIRELGYKDSWVVEMKVEP